MLAPGRDVPGAREKQKNAGYKGKTVLAYNPSLSYMSSGFPQNHVLLRAHGEGGVREILCDILKSNTGCHLSDVTAQHVLTKSKIGEEISSIQENFKKFKFSKLQYILKNDKGKGDSKRVMSHQEISSLLKVSPFCINKEAVEDEIEVQESDVLRPTNEPVSHSAVFIFLKKVLQTLIPLSVWGNQQNFQVVENFLHKLIGLGDRDIITIGRLLDRIKMKAIKWPQELSEVGKIYVVSKFFIWIVKNVIITALKAFLYPSTMSGGGSQIFFFRKEKIVALYQKNSDIFMYLPENAKVRGKVKLLPKKTEGVRPLFKGVNDCLGKKKIHDVKLLLRYLSYKEHGFKRSSSFVEDWKNALSILGKEGSLYFVKTDIKDAFGSVDTCKLKELLHSAVKDSRFVEFKKYVREGKEINIPIDKDKRPIYYQMSKNIMHDEGVEFNINVQECLSTIEAALHPAVRFGRKKVTCASGLPQGCCLSSDLCDFYYSHMISTCLHDLTTDGNGVLLRAVDDFLYLSRSKENARSFKDCITRGIPEFNCFVNKSKTITNCSSQVQRTYFNGFILCFTQETVFINTSGLAAVPARYSMTYNNAEKKSSFIMRKLLQVTGSRLPYHLVSRRYSDLNTLLDNVWRLGVLCGPRIHALVNNACDDTGKYNSKVFVNAILGVGKVVFRRIERARLDTKKLGLDIFISIFLCSIYCSLTVISCDTRKVLTGKLRDIALRKLKNVKRTDNEMLLQHLECLLTGRLLV